MPDSEKKRIKPVIEEVVEEPPKPESLPVEPAIAVEEPKAEALNKPKKEEKKLNLKLVFVIMFLSAVVAAVVSGGVYVYLSGIDGTTVKDTIEETVEPSATPSTAPAPTEAPEEEVDLSKLSVQVLNGSGIIGAAGKVEDVLVEAGFSVKNTANAQKYDYKETVIQVKASVSAGVVAKIKTALAEADYKVKVGEALPASGSYDVVVTTGAD